MKKIIIKHIELAGEIEITVTETRYKRFFKLTDEWINALRSGEYKQGKNQLKGWNEDIQKYELCCLGVLSDIQRRLRQEPTGFWCDMEPEEEFGQQGIGALDWRNEFCDISSNSGFLHSHIVYLSEEAGSLALLNDAGVPFDVIADIIDFFFTSKQYEEIPVGITDPRSKSEVITQDGKI